MPSEYGVHFAEAERAELERVVEALARWPRLSHLLRYMGEKLFSGEIEQLNEYNIATEVLGRSKAVFNAGEDAIARVEVHRLRKRLAEFYENEGKGRSIQVTLPSGSYIPVFVHKSEAMGAVTSQDLSLTSTSELHFDNWRLFPLIIWKRRYLALAAAVVVAAFGAFLYFHRGTRPIGANSEVNPVSAVVSQSPQSGASSAPLRILAGYSGPPRTDSAGRLWGPDQYFSAGASWQRPVSSISRTSDPFLFEYSRTGDFSYSIPLKPGLYELHLFFSTALRVSDGTFTFNVWVNDELVLPAFDINSDAMGEDIADERVFRDVSPQPDGFLRIKCASANGPPALNAIEILPGTPHAQLPIRLIEQTTPFTDRQGQFWQPDSYFMLGHLSSHTHPLLNSADPDLFSGERYGHFTYALPADTRDSYSVILHFAEFYFGPGLSGGGGTGSRVFKVMCNGQTLLDNFDIYKEAGSLNEVTKTFRHLRPTAQGKLNITFEPIANNATISGIEVLDESH